MNITGPIVHKQTLNSYNALIDQLSLHDKNQQPYFVVTATNRLATFLTKTYLKKNSSNVTIIANNPILSFNDWQQFLWDKQSHLDDCPILLTKHQALLLWIQCLKEDEHTLNIQNNMKAKALQNAWQIMQQWQKSLDELHTFESEHLGTQELLKHTQTFQNNLHTNNFIEINQIWSRLLQTKIIDTMLNGYIIYYLGFDLLTPLQTHILNTLSSQNTIIELIYLPTQSKNTQTATLHTFYDQKSEIEGVIQLVFQHHKKHPEQTIAIIDTYLSKHYLTYEKILDATLLHKHPLHNLNTTDKPYSISGGIDLNLVPPIQTAIQLWMLPYQNSLNIFLRTLSSDFIHINTSDNTDIREDLNQLRNTLTEIIHYSEIQAACFKIPELNTISTYLTQHQTLYKHATTNNLSWLELSEYCIQTLDLWRWCHEMPLDSYHFQACQHLLNQLHKLRDLQSIQPKITLIEGLSFLASQILKTPFQAESNHNATIQVLGILESTALPFDHLFLVGMNANLWPHYGNPNPYIPIEYQRTHSMPHSSTERETIFAIEILKRIQQQTQHFHVSYHQYDIDLSQTLTPLLDTSTFTQLRTHKLTIKTHDHSNNINTISTIWKPNLTSLSSNQINTLQGNSDLLRSMSLCPFQAQMKYRFQIKAKPNAKQPFNPAEKGNMIHYILYRIWQKIQTQAQLKRTSEQSLILDIHKAFDAFLKYRPPCTFEQIHWHRERSRVTSLILKWLDYERERPLPFTVTHLEQKYHWQYAQMNFNCRIDRIDLLENKTQMLIDYKTSAYLSAHDWHCPPFKEPQLPFYAIMLNVDSIAYAQIHGKYCKLISLECQAYKSTWKTQIQSLIQQFIEGESTANPGSHCQFCDFKTVCRVTQ